MNEIIIAAIAIVSFLIGILIGKFVFAKKSLSSISEQELLKLQRDNASLQATNEQLSERLEDSQNQYEEELALRRKETEGEGKVLEKLSPVNAIVKQMQEKIDLLEKERSEQYGQISQLMKNAQSGQDELRKVTAGLNTALRSNQARGQWGETQLKTIVEATGMLAHVDFDTQITYNDGGQNRPDMVIHLPGGRDIIIDSKVPTVGYLEACEIDEFASEENRERKKQLLAAHTQAVKTQIDGLSSREYQNINGLTTVDFVIMFIPSEAMLSSALEQDPSLLEYAFKKKIALASSVSLFSVLKTVSFVWQQQALNENAQQIGELGKELLNRVGVLAGHSERLAKSIGNTVDSYNKFAGSLESQVVTTANKIATALEQAELAAPEPIELATREFTKPELGEKKKVEGE